MFGNFKRLLSVVGLRDEKIFRVDAQFFGIRFVKGMFGVDEGRQPPFFLGFGNTVHRERGFSRITPARKSPSRAGGECRRCPAPNQDPTNRWKWKAHHSPSRRLISLRRLCRRLFLIFLW